MPYPDPPPPGKRWVWKDKAYRGDGGWFLEDDPDYVPPGVNPYGGTAGQIYKDGVLQPYIAPGSIKQILYRDPSHFTPVAQRVPAPGSSGSGQSVYGGNVVPTGSAMPDTLKPPSMRRDSRARRPRFSWKPPKPRP